jgi:hypothetical protein
VNPIEKQHQLGIDLLEQLGVSNIRLEQKPDGSYRYFAWNASPIHRNGSPPIVKRGKIKVSV